MSDKKPVYILGSSGFVGSHITQFFKLEDQFKVCIPRLDVTEFSQLEKYFSQVEPGVVINATGKSGATIDWCENHRLETYEVLVKGAIDVACIASRYNHYVLHIGSGCIFTPDKNKSYTEEDTPNFWGNVYSQCKALSEQILKELPNVCVLRIRLPISSAPHPKNLITKLLGYTKVVSTPESITILDDLVSVLPDLISKGYQGVFNAVNPGVFTNKLVLQYYQDISGKILNYQIVPDLSQESQRVFRASAILSTHRQKKLGVSLPPLQGSLKKVIQEYIAKE